ncbi:MAG: LysR family transcriptional regulator [Gammaproteobacteria bacterium 28-57-27]|nr:MAG: LysR family transcriptional regulator [Gammaproteobacteria bacterium 28-57-27]
MIQALAETGSVSAAAERVHLTQSALSHQLGALERYLGVTLLDRSRRPLRLSAAGERLLLAARRTLPEVEAARAEVLRLSHKHAPEQLRIAVECHSCFDWLMPAMDAYRAKFAEAELDLVSGFLPEPLDLLLDGRADLAVVSTMRDWPGVSYLPLFRYEIVALLAPGHVLADKPWLGAQDFSGQTLITYPVPDQALDVVQRVLKPAGISPERRTAELTVAILQLVASRRGLAALPRWAAQAQIERGYVQARPIGEQGLWSSLYAAFRSDDLALRQRFVEVLRQSAFQTLGGLMQADALA